MRENKNPHAKLKKELKRYNFYRWRCTGRERWSTWALDGVIVLNCPNLHNMKKIQMLTHREVIRDVLQYLGEEYPCVTPPV